MAEHIDESRLTALEMRLRRYKRWLAAGVVAWLATLLIVLVTVYGFGGTRSDSIRVRRLVVVDENGQERIVIAAPIPDPMVNGEVRRRRTVVSAGVQFKDPNGTERGGDCRFGGWIIPVRHRRRTGS
jgi:hypothetical protein